MFLDRQRIRRSCSAALVLLGMAACGPLAGCGGDDPADRATASARQLLADFTAGHDQAVCAELTQAGQASLIAAARTQADGQITFGSCAGASRFLLDGTPTAGRNALTVTKDPTDVDILADGARVKWKDCCTFAVEEVGGAYRVSDARDLGLYFDVAGAGAGAGAGSPSATPANATKDRIDANLKASARKFAKQHFRDHVRGIRVDGPRVTLITDLPLTDSTIVGVCRAASGDQDTDPVAELPGISQLLVRPTDDAVQDCAELMSVL